jgi:hypothetical protein
MEGGVMLCGDREPPTTIFVCCQECKKYADKLDDPLMLFIVKGREHVVCQPCARELGWI